MPMVTAVPFFSMKRRVSSSPISSGCPSTAVMMSPLCRPASCAGDSVEPSSRAQMFEALHLKSVGQRDFAHSNCGVTSTISTVVVSMGDGHIQK